jgi:hypothetical protein
MKNSIASKIFALALAGSALAAAAPPTGAGPVRPFKGGAGGPVLLTYVSGPAVPSAGSPVVFDFVEPNWEGNETHLGTFLWNAQGTITFYGVTSSGAWQYRAHGATCSLTAANGDTIAATFDAVGTLDPNTGVASSTGTYELTGGTGRFSNVQGAGTTGISGTAADGFCPFIGWIQY